MLPYLASRGESCPVKGKHHFCSLRKAHCPILEELTRLSNWHCYLSVLYPSLSLLTECKFMPTFLRELKLHQLISTLLLLPPGLSKSLFHRSNSPRWLGLFKSPITGLPLEMNFLSDPILCTVLLGNPRTAHVSDYWNCGDDCQKTRNRDLSLSCYQPSWWGERQMIYDHSLKWHKTDYRGRFQLKSSGSKPACIVWDI